MRRALVILALLLVVSGLSAWNALLGPLHWGDTKDQVRAALWPMVEMKDNDALWYMDAFGVNGLLVSYWFVDGRLDRIAAGINQNGVMNVINLFDRSYIYPQELDLLTEPKPDRVLDGNGRIADFWSFNDQVDVFMIKTDNSVSFCVCPIGRYSRVP